MVKTVSTSFALVSAAAVVSLTLIGCVDARGAYDDYADRLVDASTQDVDGMIVSELPEVDGEWLIAVRPNLPEDRIIQFRSNLDLTPVTANTGKIDIDATPLTVADRTPIGEAFVASGRDVASDATFAAPFIGVLPGEANPVSGSEADIDAVMHAELRGDDFLCGTLTGQAGPLPLEGTTWAAVRITGDTLPQPVFTCAGDPTP